MKHKFSLMWRVAVALVLVLSFSLVAAVPVSAAFTDAVTTAAVIDITPASAWAGEDDVGILDVAVTEGNVGADLITSVVVTSVCTSDADVEFVKLYWDSDLDGVFNPAVDTLLGTSTGFVAATATFTAGGVDGPGTGSLEDGVGGVNDGIDIAQAATERFYVAFDVVAYPTDTNTLDAQILALGITMAVAGTGEVAPLHPAGVSTIDSDMDITDVAIADAGPLPGATNVAVQRVTFTEPGSLNAVNVQTVKISNVGSDTYVDKVALWEDVDDDGVFEPIGDDILGELGSGTFTSGAIVIGTMGVTLFDIPAGAGATTQDVFVVYDISSLSPDGAQFKSRIVNPSLDVTFDLGSDTSAAPVTSTNPQTVTTAITIAVSASNPGIGNIGAGRSNIPVQAFEITDCGSTTDIDVVSIDQTGSAIFGVDVTKVSLWKDDGDGVFDVASDILLGSNAAPTAATNIGTADVVLTSLTASETGTFWITVDTSAIATVGLTVITRIGDAIADISVTTTSLGTKLDAVNALSGNAQTITRALAIATSGDPADTSPGAGQTDVLVQGFTVTDSGNAAGTDIDVVSIDETGSVDFGTVTTSDVTKVSLWRDDGDGVFDVNSDTLLGSDTTPGATSTIGTADVVLTNVANAATVQFWITVDIQASATGTTPTDGQTIVTQVGDAVADISVTSTSQGQQLAVINTLTSTNPQTIERNIVIADPGVVVAGTTGVGQSNVLVNDFTLTDCGNAAGSDIDIVSIDETGSATFGSASTTDVSKVSLWRDDGDGVFNANLDTLLGEDITPAATSTIGTANVVLTNIADGATVTFWLTVDVRATATNGATIILSVDDAVTDISMTATSQGLQLAAGVLANPTITIDRNITIVNSALNPAAANIGVGRTDLLIHAFDVTDSGNAAGTDIDIVSIDDINTAVFGTDVTKVSLWQDTGTTGFQGAGVDTLLGEDTTPGATSTIGSHDVVLVNVPDGLAITLFMTVDIPATATDARIVQTQVGDAVTDLSVTSTSQGLQLVGVSTIVSNNQTIDNNVALAAVAGVPAAGTTGKGSTDVLVQAFTVTDSGNGGGTQIDTVSIDRDAAAATANFATDLTKISLWLDTGVAGFQGAGVDTLLGENTSPANEGTVIGTADTVLLDLTQGQTRTLYVTVDTSTGIVTGTTIATQIGDEADDVSVTSTSVGQGSAVAAIVSANPITVADNMTIAAGPSNPPVQSFAGGQTDVLIQAFRLTGAVVSGGTDIDTITIENNGADDWAGDPGVVTNIDVSKISLWRDEGAAGFQGSGVDTLLGSSTSPLSAGTTFGTVGTVLTHLDSGQGVQFLVTADIAENADDDATAETVVGDEVADITVTTTSPGTGLAAISATASATHVIHRLTSAATLSATYALGSTVVVRVDASLGAAFAGTVTVETDEPAGTVLALDDGAGYDGTAADGIFYAQFLTQSAGEHSGTVYLNGIAKAIIAYTTTPTVILVSISAEPESVSLAVDETQELAVTATYSDDSTAVVTTSADCTYVSDDTTVATVTSPGGGLITAEAEGSATITVSYTEFGVTKIDTVSVTVSAVTLESIAASPLSVSLDVDETQELTVTATYSDDTTAVVTTSADCTYVSDDTTVATVTSPGGGLITAVAEGSATITVSYTEFGVTKTDTVSVTVSVFNLWDYDADGDGVISKAEALTSVTAYFDGVITIEQALAVIAEYMW